MQFSTDDTVLYKPAEGKSFECKIISTTADHVNVKLTADDKDLQLVVGDKVKHDGNDMIITAVGGDRTYGIGNGDDGDGALAFAGGITREDLTLVEGVASLVS